MKAVYNVDLRNYYSSVKNQGACGNCYAMSTVENVNIQNIINAKNVPALSYQQLTDCSKGYYNNNGCNGGWLYESLNFIQVYGLYSESTYPQSLNTFQNNVAGTCKSYNSQKYTIKGWYYFLDYSCMSRVNVLHARTSISIAVAGGSFPFQYYHSGILSGCGNYPYVDHAVVLMGISLNTGMGNYWVIKNSWGTGWGEGGYIRINPTND